jgi:hypothetical protein
MRCGLYTRNATVPCVNYTVALQKAYFLIMLCKDVYAQNTCDRIDCSSEDCSVQKGIPKKRPQETDLFLAPRPVLWIKIWFSILPVWNLYCTPHGHTKLSYFKFLLHKIEPKKVGTPQKRVWPPGDVFIGSAQNFLDSCVPVLLDGEIFVHILKNVFLKMPIAE